MTMTAKYPTIRKDDERAFIWDDIMFQHTKTRAD